MYLTIIIITFTFTFSNLQNMPWTSLEQSVAQSRFMPQNYETQNALPAAQLTINNIEEEHKNFINSFFWKATTLNANTSLTVKYSSTMLNNTVQVCINWLDNLPPWQTTFRPALPQMPTLHCRYQSDLSLMLFQTVEIHSIIFVQVTSF